MKEKILRLIDAEIDKLNEQDVQGHIWWNKFKELLDSIPGEEEVIDVDIESLTKDNDFYQFKKNK